jgi:hypothetical protein
MPVIIALEKLHKIPVKPWTGPFLTQGNLALLKSRLLVQVTPPQPLYRCLMESRPSDVTRLGESCRRSFWKRQNPFKG